MQNLNAVCCIAIIIQSDLIDDCGLAHILKRIHTRSIQTMEHEHKYVTDGQTNIQIDR